MQENQLNLFSFKILIHRVSLTKLAFKNEEVVLQKPGFKIKFVDFPHMIIMAKSSMYLEDFSNKENFIQTKKEEVKQFGKGKSVFLNAKYQDMIEYLDKYALIIQLKDFKHQNHQTIGKCLLNMDMFIKDVKYIISDDIERFRRNTFKLTDNDNNCIGWFDMSISILQRPVSCITKMISKKLGSFEQVEPNQDKATIQNDNQKKQQKGNILVVDNSENDKKKKPNDNNKEENEDTYKVTVMKASSSKDEDEDLSDSSVLRINDFQGPQSQGRRRSSQNSLDLSQKQTKKSGQLQVIQRSGSKEMATFGNDNKISNNLKSPPNNYNLQNSTDEYVDDFELSNVQTSIQQQSLSYQQVPKNKPANNRQQVDTEENYEEDFESMSASQSYTVNKKQITDRKKSTQQDVSVSRMQDDAISEVYTEDFESMSISQSQPKPKNQLKPIRR